MVIIRTFYDPVLILCPRTTEIQAGTVSRVDTVCGVVTVKNGVGSSGVPTGFLELKRR